MSRTTKGQKHAGYEYRSRRPGRLMSAPSAFPKRVTVRAERREAASEIGERVAHELEQPVDMTAKPYPTIWRAPVSAYTLTEAHENRECVCDSCMHPVFVYRRWLRMVLPKIVDRAPVTTRPFASLLRNAA